METLVCIGFKQVTDFGTGASLVHTCEYVLLICILKGLH